MKYQILNEKGNIVKEIESNSTYEEILRNYPVGYKIRPINDENN